MALLQVNLHQRNLVMTTQKTRRVEISQMTMEDDEENDNEEDDIE